MLVTVLKYVLITVEAVCSLLLIGIILIQRTKSQGMGMAFGAAMGESLFGSQVGNVLTKTTVTLAIIFLVNTTLLAVLGTQRGEQSATDGVSGSPVPAQTAPVEQGPIPAGAPMDFPASPVGDVPMAAESAPMVDVPMAAPEAAPAPSE